MKLTLPEKRMIVTKFMRGVVIDHCAVLVWNALVSRVSKLEISDCRLMVQQVLHDYLNGKFKLKPKRKSRGGQA